MTPLLREMQGEGSKDYELKARERLTKFAKTEDICMLISYLYLRIPSTRISVPRSYSPQSSRK